MFFLFSLNEKGSILKLRPLKLNIWKAFIGEDIKSYIYPVIKISIVRG